MPPSKKKKKLASNPARGFATTSVPSKAKPTTTKEPSLPPPPVHAPPTAVPSSSSAAIAYSPPTEEEQEEQELQSLVLKHGAKVRREAQRIVSNVETDKRMLRKTAIPLKLEKTFELGSASALTRPESLLTGEERAGEEEGGEGLGDLILRLAKEEYELSRQENGENWDLKAKKESVLVNAWTLHKTLLALGFAREKAEEALRVVMESADAAGKERAAEGLLEEVLDWMALYCAEEDLPGFVELPGNATAGKKVIDTPSSNVSQYVTPTASGISTPYPPLPQKADTRHLNARQAPFSEPSPTLPKRSTSPVCLAAEISNLALKTKDVAADDSGGGLQQDLSDDEITPEELIPLYIEIQTSLYQLHPLSCTNWTRKNGSLKIPGKPAPPGLPPTVAKEINRLQEKRFKLERDPLFDIYVAEVAWKEQRLKLEKESWAKKALEPPPQKTKPTLKPKPPPPESDSDTDSAGGGVLLRSSSSLENDDDDDDLGLDIGGIIGDIFEPPPTSEPSTTSGEKISIHDFATVDPQKTNNLSLFDRKKGKGRAGVGGAAAKKSLEEVCRSRDVNARLKWMEIPGTSISYRMQITISWGSSTYTAGIQETSPSDLSTEIPVTISKPSENQILFSMKSISTPTKEQAEGYISTYAMYELFSQIAPKSYSMLPTIWRAVWMELLDQTRIESERHECLVLKGLKRILGIDGKAQDEDQIRVVASGERRKRLEKDEGDEKAEGRREKQGYEKVLEGEVIREDWKARTRGPAYLQMLEHRKRLPMWAFKEEVLKTIDREQVVIICGETGCGKSTQTPAFILEHELSNGRPCKIYCTEPRRISAISLARRVSEELGEKRNELGGRRSLIGYAIRLESNMHAGTRLVYATTGIVMRMLERSSELEGVTHLVLDEVHERSIDSDFLLIVLRKLLVKRKDLKVILMSATVDSERFSNYLNGAPVLNVPGRTFPVKTHYLEDAIEMTHFVVEDNPRKRGRYNNNDWDDLAPDDDVVVPDSNSGYTASYYSPETRTALSRLNPYHIAYELIIRLLETIAFTPEYTHYSKAILVFLPGLGEIRRLNDMLQSHHIFGNTDGWLVYPLHSTIASEDQEAAFLIPPPGVRKIVVATNIAETGITIPDVTAVIDSGRHKEMRFDEKRQVSRLVETFISRANAKQRRGRAGRVQEGICWHLFTKERHDNLLAEQQTPEIMRLSLQDLALRVKICKLGNVEEVLTQALDSPLVKNIRRAVESLVEVKALTQAEELTPLGRQLAKLPLDVYLGKMVLLGCIYGCLDAVITIAATLSSKSPFVAPIGFRKEGEQAKLSFRRGDSDLLTAWNAYSSWRRVCQSGGKTITEYEFCRKNYLSPRTLSAVEDLKQQLFVSIIDAGFLILTPEERSTLNRSRFSNCRPGSRTFFIPPEHINHASENDAIMNAVIAAGFYPKLLTRDGKGWKGIANSQNIMVQPGSVNRENHTSAWLSYYGIMQSNKYYDAQETSHVEDIAVALLCGDVDFKMYPGILVLDGNRVRFSFQDWKTMVAVKILRTRLKEVMTRAFRSSLSVAAGGSAERSTARGGAKALAEAERRGRWVDVFFRAVGGGGKGTGTSTGTGTGG